MKKEKILLALLVLFFCISGKAKPKPDIEKDSVISVSLWSDSTIKKAYFGQKILLKTKGIDSLIRKNEHIILFINDTPINSCEAKPSIKNRKNLIFDLGDTTAIHEIWNLFYSPNKSEKSLRFSAGIKGGEALPTKGGNFTLIFYFKSWLYGAYIAIALLLVMFILLATNSNIIKDTTYSLNPPYSLSRFQLGFWTYIIVSSFIYIWIIKDDFNSLNSTALILLGISALTAVSGTIINNNQKDQDASNTLQKKSSNGFFFDLLSDENGVSVHRFQNLLFNFVLGFIFLDRVYENLLMPSFNDTLLTLMGISASTYAALKATENRAIIKGDTPSDTKENRELKAKVNTPNGTHTS